MWSFVVNLWFTLFNLDYFWQKSTKPTKTEIKQQLVWSHNKTFESQSLQKYPKVSNLIRKYIKTQYFDQIYEKHVTLQHFWPVTWPVTWPAHNTGLPMTHASRTVHIFSPRSVTSLYGLLLTPRSASTLYHSKKIFSPKKFRWKMWQKLWCY